MRIKAQWGPTFSDKVPEILSRAYGPIVYAQIIRILETKHEEKSSIASLLCNFSLTFWAKSAVGSGMPKWILNPHDALWKPHPCLTRIWTENLRTFIAACQLVLSNQKLKLTTLHPVNCFYRSCLYMKVGALHSLHVIVSSHLTKK